MPLFVRPILIAVLVASGASSALAGNPLAKPDSADARDHLARGNKLYSVRDFEKAIDEYKAGALVEQAPVFDYNLGQCYRQLGDYEAAKWHYEQFLRRGQPEGKVIEAVNGFISQMDAELQKKAMSQQPTEAAPTEAVSEQPAAPVEPVAKLSDTAPTPPHRSFRALAWGLTGAGVVGVGVGGALLWNASSLRDDANNTVDQSTRDALFEKADSRSLLGTVIGISGGALLAAGVITFVLDRPSDSRSTTAWTMGASPHGIFAVGQF